MERRRAPSLPGVAAAGLAVALAVRLGLDVHSKPVYEDEALAGLVSARPLRELLATAVVDRGGAPLHFVLAHLALAADPSPAAGRWLSVVFAVAAVPVCYDLGRRLAGPVAGVVGAGVVATSQLVGIYGSVDRMYALFAFTSAVALDLFVRACTARTRRAAVLAAVAALVVVATHPFGIVLAGAEGVAAVVFWRKQGGLRALLPVAAIAALAIPFLLVDLRFASRFSAGVSGDHALVTPRRAVAVLGRALGGLAGGREPLVVLFVALVVVGAVALWRRRPEFVVASCILLAALPLLLVLIRSQRGFSDHLGAPVHPCPPRLVGPDRSRRRAACAAHAERCAVGRSRRVRRGCRRRATGRSRSQDGPFGERACARRAGVVAPDAHRGRRRRLPELAGVSRGAP